MDNGNADGSQEICKTIIIPPNHDMGDIRVRVYVFDSDTDISY